MNRTAERVLLVLAAACLLAILGDLVAEVALGCDDARDARASGFIDQPSGDRSWSWVPPGVECRYSFDESPDITVTIAPPLARVPAMLLSIGTIWYVLGQRRTGGAQPLVPSPPPA